MSRMRRIMIILSMMAGLLSASVWAEDTADTEAMEGVAAVVNDQVISFSDVRHRVRLLLLSLNIEANEQSIAEARVHALRALIDEHLQLQEAASFELEVSDEELDQQIAELALRNSVTMEVFLSDLMARNINPETLRQQLRAQTAWQRLIIGIYGQRVRVSQLQIDGTLARMSRSLEQERFRIAEILLSADTPEQMQQVWHQAQSIREQIANKGTPFQLAAQQFSAAPSASSGGDLGWVTHDALSPELVQALEKMDTETLSDPIKTDDGVYLIVLIDRKAPASEQDEVLHLGQIASFDRNAASKVAEIRQTYADCEALAAASTRLQDGIIVSDLGDVRLDSLSETVREAVAATRTGQWTQPVEIRGGAATMLVCARMSGKELSLPDRRTVENSLFENHMARLSTRYLRDLRREAAIVQPQSVEHSAEPSATPS